MYHKQIFCMKLKAFFSAMVAVLKGIAPDDKKTLLDPLEAQVAAMQDEETPTGDKSKKADEDDTKISADVKAVLEENKQLKELMQKIIDRDTQREKTDTERAADALKVKVAEKIEALKKSGIIPADNKDLEGYWNKMLTADFDGASKIVDGLPKAPGSSTSTKTKTGDGSDKTGDSSDKTSASSMIGRAANSKMLQYVNSSVESQ